MTLRLIEFTCCAQFDPPPPPLPPSTSLSLFTLRLESTLSTARAARRPLSVRRPEHVHHRQVRTAASRPASALARRDRRRGGVRACPTAPARRTAARRVRHVRRAPGACVSSDGLPGTYSAPIALMPASFSPSLLSASKPSAVRVQRQGLDEQCDQSGRAELQPGVRRAQQTTVGTCAARAHGVKR